MMLSQLGTVLRRGQLEGFIERKVILLLGLTLVRDPTQVVLKPLLLIGQEVTRPRLWP